jgi:hypothetical protein
MLKFIHHGWGSRLSIFKLLFCYDTNKKWIKISDAASPSQLQSLVEARAKSVLIRIKYGGKAGHPVNGGDEG